MSLWCNVIKINAEIVRKTKRRRHFNNIGKHNDVSASKECIHYMNYSSIEININYTPPDKCKTSSIAITFNLKKIGLHSNKNSTPLKLLGNRFKLTSSV